MRFSIEYIDWELSPCDPAYDFVGKDLPTANEELTTVPVIRVFGLNEEAETVCCFIHNVFPYIYVEYSSFAETLDLEVPDFLSQLQTSINYALALAARANPETYKPAVQSVQLVKGIPFYGYSFGFQKFLKICLFSPKNRDRLVDLFRQGAILNKVIQVYESHLPYLLQFMVDHNLYGCAPIDLDDSIIKRDDPLSFCNVEVHVSPNAILNACWLSERNIHTDLYETHASSPNSLLVTSLAELWKSEASRRNLTSSDETNSFSKLHQSQFGLKEESSHEPRSSQHWKNEVAMKDLLKNLIKSKLESSSDVNTPLIFDPWPELPTIYSAIHTKDYVRPSQNDISVSQISVDEKICTSYESLPKIQLEQNTAPVIESSFEQLDSELERILGDTLFDSFPYVEPNVDRSKFPKSPLNSSQEVTIHSSQDRQSPPSSPLKDVPSQINPFSPSLRLKGGSPITKREIEFCRDLPNRPTSSEPNQGDTRKAGKRLKYSRNLDDYHICTQIPEDYSPKFLSQHESFVYKQQPPSTDDLYGTMKKLKIPFSIPTNVHYSSEKDIPSYSQEYLGKSHYPIGVSSRYLPEFQSDGSVSEKVRLNPLKLSNFHGERTWQYIKPAPLAVDLSNLESKEAVSEEIQSPQRLSRSKVFRKDPYSCVRILALELFCCSHGGLTPDPTKDSIECCFWAYQEDVNSSMIDRVGFIVVDKSASNSSFGRSFPSCTVLVVNSELELINEVIGLNRQLDPTIVCGYEVHNSSWGYLIERASYRFNYDLPEQLSRLKCTSKANFAKKENAWKYTTTSSINIVGRHVLNIWRILRGEVNLLNYSLENVVLNIFKKQTPYYNQADKVHLWQSSRFHEKQILLNYMLNRTRYCLEILSACAIVTKIREQARIIGIDFMSVISRGSQFKVESIMFRIAKPENYIFPSPSAKQVAEQNALEALPLVMEPKSDLYNNPVVVLDFQSLYPSIIIAYNLCYSTCLGPVKIVNGKVKLGFMFHSSNPNIVNLIKNDVYISPNGYAYVKENVRKSLLAKMLEELIETRNMVKRGMKDCDSDYVNKVLNSRQLALKLIANVTYGYTSASFSGRMPCSEIADTIVETGREILSYSLEYINTLDFCHAKVVYGDTDSLFVELPGATKEQAFDIGQQLANNITSRFPSPIRLKFEKIYFPCFLLAKKRYVGFKFESVGQKAPIFEAKGIETVRRDGTPVQQQLLRRCLEILFKTKDLSTVKKEFQNVCYQIMSGNVPVMDFCFSKEVRLEKYKELSTAPPGAVMARRLMTKDPRREPQYGERVPYLIIAAAPGTTLANRSVAPEEFLSSSFSQLDINYYINNSLIPPLDRFLNLLGASAQSWYHEMPKPRTSLKLTETVKGGIQKKTLDTFLMEKLCSSCLKNNIEIIPDKINSLCSDCLKNPCATISKAVTQHNAYNKKLSLLFDICRGCSKLSSSDPVLCKSNSCKVYYDRAKTENYAKVQAEMLTKTLGSLDW